MRQEVIGVLKSSKSSFMRSLVADDPVAMFRWNMVKAVFRAMNAFKSVVVNQKQLRRAGKSSKF
jgi:hypothetical protein